jgi:hypothetical protein
MSSGISHRPAAALVQALVPEAVPAAVRRGPARQPLVTALDVIGQVQAGLAVGLALITMVLLAARRAVIIAHLEITHGNAP